jgi:glutathione S-transferase
VFRYFDVFDTLGDFGFWPGLPKVQAWRGTLSERPSVRQAVAADYPERLRDFLQRRGSALSTHVQRSALAV